MLGFIAGLVAGFLAPYAEAPLARPVAALLDKQIGVEPNELRALSFILMMLIAGVVSAIFESGTALGVIAGGALGYFATRIVAALRELIDARRS